MHEHTTESKQPESIMVGALATNCWLYPLIEAAPEPGIAVHRPCAVIDPGAEADLIIARIERLHLYPRYVLLTHGHFDHLAALPDLIAHYRDVQIAIHQEDAQYLGPDAYRVHRAAFLAVAGSAAYVDALWESIPAPTTLLTEGDTIGPFQVLHLPGHSPGSVGFYDADMKLLFSGDTLFKQGIGRTDLPGGDWNALQKSLKRLLVLDEDIRVYPGHGSETTIGAER